MKGWSVVMPDPGEVAARAERAYWRSLTPEEQRAEMEREGKSSSSSKSPSEIAAIVAEQNRQLGTAVWGRSKTGLYECHEQRERHRFVCAARGIDPDRALQMRLVDAARAQRSALQISRWSRLDVAGAEEMGEAAALLRLAASDLESVAREIRSCATTRSRSEGVGVQVEAAQGSGGARRMTALGRCPSERGRMVEVADSAPSKPSVSACDVGAGARAGAERVRVEERDARGARRSRAACAAP
jgi:hypothetical protein